MCPNQHSIPFSNVIQTTISITKILFLFLAILSLSPLRGGPFAAGLRDPLTRYNDGTIEIDTGIMDRIISVNPSKYFKSMDTDSKTETFDEWLAVSGNSYENSMYYSSKFTNSMNHPEEGVAIFWTIEEDTISLAIIARATGWVGFGISDSGGMKSSDIILYSAANDEIEDAHIVDENIRPIKDTKQHSVMIKSKSEGGFIIVELSRALDTEDEQDRPFLDDSDITKPPSRFIAAWGDGEVGYHGPFGRVQGRVRFFGDRAGPEVFAFREYMLEDIEATPVEVKYGIEPLLWRQAGEVPPVEDSTRVRCFEMQDLASLGFPTSEAFFSDNSFPAQQSVHIMGIERIPDATAEPLIRRVNLYKATAPNKLVCRDTGIEVGSYDDTLLTPTTRDLVRADLIYSWATGSESVAFPNNTGILFGDKPMGLIMEVAYYNPSLKDGVIDHSGFTLWITTDLRPNNIGIARFGTFTGGSNSFFKNFAGFPSIPLLEGTQEHIFTCPSTCTKNRLPENGVTVIREQLSMNTSPKAMHMSNKINRGGNTVREGSVDLYVSNQNGYHSTREDLPFQVLPGDSIETKCYYNADVDTLWYGENKVIGNTGGNEIYLDSVMSTETLRSDEQCMSILYYYPANKDDIGLVCDVSTGRGTSLFPFNDDQTGIGALPPFNDDQTQEDQGCVAIHSIASSEPSTTTSTMPSISSAPSTETSATSLPSVLSPQEKAMNWINNEDEADLTLESQERINQRYVLAVFAFSFNSNQWYNCGAPVHITGKCLVDSFYEESGQSDEVEHAAWLSKHHECTWYGVWCDYDGNVVRLEIINNNLAGPFSKELATELASLEHLQFLEFPGNELTGEIPTEIEDIKSLRVLKFTVNNMKGEIPEELYNLTLLENIVLGGNDFSGQISTKIGQLTILKGFHVFDTLMDGPIPSEIGKLSSLTHLRLHDTAFTGQLPSEITKLTRLTEFWNHRTLMTGVLPENIGDMVDLELLYINESRYSGSLPASFYKLSKLKEFFAWDIKNDYSEPKTTGINGTISPDIKDMTELVLFIARNNNFEGQLPDEFGDLTKLSHVWLHFNDIVGESPFCDKSYPTIQRQQYDEVEMDCLEVTDDDGTVITPPKVSCPCCTVCCAGGICLEN